MTITSAMPDHPFDTALYAPRMEQPAAPHGDIPRANTSGQTPMQLSQPFEPVAQSPAAPMLEHPFDLQIQGEQGTPQLTLYSPTPPRNPAPPPQAPAHMPVAKMSGQDAPEGEGAKTMEEINEENSCPVCENRKYQDGSDDPGVSLKFATKLNRFAATSAIRAHEYQHVRHHQNEADEQDRKVISQTVMLRTRTCPCCGKMYTAGGVTKTVTAAYQDHTHKSAQSGGGQSVDACV